MYKKQKSCPLKIKGQEKKTIPAVPPKLILKRIRLCLVPSYKSALITGADHPLTATHQTAFGHPQKSIHKLPEYRLSANGDSLQDE